MHRDKRNGQGGHVIAVPPDRSRWLRRTRANLIQFLLLAVVLAATSACATEPMPQSVASEALRPYLGKWRPTSYGEGLNIGSLTITETELSVEVGGASLSYELERQTSEGVILRVTGRQPDHAFPGIAALAFSVKLETVTGPPPAGITKIRELLRICYWSGSLDRLAVEVTKAPCGNAYTR